MSDTQAQRILVVDDELECRNMVQKMLQKMGHTCEVAEDAFEALARIADKRFDRERLVIQHLKDANAKLQRAYAMK